MQTEGKEYMLVIAKNNRIFIFLILIPLMLFAFQYTPGVVAADDHKEHESGDKRYENREERYVSRVRKERQLKRDDDGNEVTGQTAAWLLVAGQFYRCYQYPCKKFEPIFFFQAKYNKLDKEV